jgi:hypothetical protein
MGEVIEFKSVNAVDKFQDIDDALNKIDVELVSIFRHNAHRWWSTPNPRMGNFTPESLWNKDPALYPWARDFVYEKVISIRTFNPETEPKTAEVRKDIVAELGAKVATLVDVQ